MIRQTSIDCYNEIKKSGLLSKMRFNVYEALLKIGKPSTVREVYDNMDVEKMEATRFTELRDLGVIYEKGTRKCNITGRMAIEWDLTDKLPEMKLERKQTPKSLRRSVNYIIDKMNKEGLMFIDSTYLEKLIP